MKRLFVVRLVVAMVLLWMVALGAFAFGLSAGRVSAVAGLKGLCFNGNRWGDCNKLFPSDAWTACGGDPTREDRIYAHGAATVADTYPGDPQVGRLAFGVVDENEPRSEVMGDVMTIRVDRTGYVLARCVADESKIRKIE